MGHFRIIEFRALAVACWMCVVTAALVVFPGVARAQIGPEQPQAQYKRMQAQVASMTELPAKDVSEIFQLKMDGNALALSTPLIEADHARGTFRVSDGLFKGPTFASVSAIGTAMAVGIGARPPGAAANQGVVKVFSFINYELPNPDELVSVTVQSFGTRLQITRMTRTGTNGYRQMSLTQQRMAEGPAGAAPGQSPVQLSVVEFGNNGPGGVSKNFTVQAADFQALLREHGPEVDEYVRPVLRQIGQQSALAPDGRVAWQVLADDWRPDPQLTRRAEQLLPALNAVDFHARDKALAELQAMGMPGATVLTHLDRSGLSPEQNLLIDRTLAPFSQLSPGDAKRLRRDTDFLTDCLYLADRDIRAAALERLKQVTGKDLAFDIDVAEARRPAAVSALRKQLGPKAAEGATTEPVK
jgi:hypothetical protein